MRKSIIALAALATLGSATAASNTFKFRVFSSGADIFPCNAGIMHSGTHTPVGYTIDTSNPDYNGSGSEVIDSVTETSRPGSFLPDFMRYQIVKFDEWTEEKIAQSVKKEHSKWGRSAGKNSWEAIYDDNKYMSLDLASDISYEIHKENDVNNVVSGLDFVLSSENYGAKYFVDICYYAPQFDVFSTSGRSYNLTSRASFTNLVSGRDYLDRATVNADVQVYCDGDFKKSTTEEQMLAQSEKTFFSGVKIDNGSAPKKCVVRYTFSETSEARRNHAAHGGIFTLFTDITDPGQQ
ncbi:MAG: hypothetical protein KAG61_05685 [Bacteriovoracaceae bacterium]|nr:hypothetical protein [Bacteriovoracaceae bacterium]